MAGHVRSRKITLEYIGKPVGGVLPQVGLLGDSELTLIGQSLKNVQPLSKLCLPLLEFWASFDWLDRYAHVFERFSFSEPLLFEQVSRAFFLVPSAGLLARLFSPRLLRYFAV